jgi:hypothetical protein
MKKERPMTRKSVFLGAAAALTSAAAVLPVVSSAAAHPSPGAGNAPMMNDAVALQAMPRGSAWFYRGMNGDLAVRLSVTGLTPGSQHNVDVEAGMCPTTFRLGADLAPAAVVTANGGGQVDQTVDLGRPARALPFGRLSLTIRQGLTANQMDGGSNPLAVQGLACARVPHRVGFFGRSRRLVPVSESNMPLSGWTSFSYNGHDSQSATGQSVTVTIHASGFVPGSVHAAHVHSGTCANQGGVVVMLPDLTADANGNLSATDTVPVSQQPQGPLYVNVHEGNMNTILSNGMPTLAFRPLLCGDLRQAPAVVGSPMPMPMQPPMPMPIVTGKHW